MGEILETLLCLIVLGLLFSIKIAIREFWWNLGRDARMDPNQRQETKESLDQVTYRHSPHWEYLLKVTSWQTRLKLSRLRGKKRALTRKLKQIASFTGMDSQVEQWLLEEYMITAKADELPAPDGSWRCAHCGCHNADTAIFCKDCGEYK